MLVYIFVRSQRELRQTKIIMLKFLILISSLPLVTASFAQASIKPRSSMVRFTAEELTLPGNETMGLLGSSYLVHLNRHFYTGLGIYSAVTGQRGGFFTGGLESGFKYKLGHQLELDAGLFVGGGGGGAAPQGGGLMIRPQIGLMSKTDIGKFGIQASQVRFPNGDINSTQLSISYEKPLSLLHSSGWIKNRGSNYSGNSPPPEQDFSVLLQNYDLPDGTLNTSGAVQDTDVSLIGVEWDYYFGKRAFFRLQTLGALSGNSDGYASVLMGLGYRYPFAGNNTLKLAATMGASGGGGIDTGGGVTNDISINLQHRFDSGLLTGIRAGLVNAPDGDFEATSLAAYVGYGDRAANKKHFSSADIKPRHWRIRTTHQTYKPKGDTRRKGQTTPDNRDIHLLALQTDLFMNKYLYLTGQAIGAYDGDAGGYAAGLVGAGITRPLWKNSRLLWTAETAVGAAGGGGLAVGDGLIGQGMLGLAYRTSRSRSLHLALGITKSKNGNFEANTINLGFAYRFTTLAWK